MSRLRLAGAACCALLLNTLSAQAQTVDEIVARNLAAKGGVELLQATTSVKITGRVKQPAGEVAMTVWAKRPNLKRVEAEMGGQKLVQGFDGSTAWVSRGAMPPQALGSGPQLDAIRQQAEFDTVFLNYKERGYTVELTGRTKVDGVDVHQLRVTSKDGQVKQYFLDVETGLERRAVTTIGPDAAQVEERFSDYRSVQGRMVPFSIGQYANGKVLAETRVEAVEFNVPIEEAFFRMPARQPR